MQTLSQRIETAVTSINSKCTLSPSVGVILGSGLGDFVNKIKNPIVIPFGDIPNFKKVTVKGHDGNLIIGTVGEVTVAALQGRFHYYEGNTLDEVVFPIRVLAKLGIKTLLLSNAAGGINLNFNAGNLMLIQDHVNLTGVNPLIGPNDESIGPRFPDMTFAYNPELNQLIKESAKELNIDLKEGIYIGVSGPTYETPAEIRFFRTIGGDACGMSTVPETIVANHIGLRVAGISCITNMAAGIKNEKLSHDDIKGEANKVMENFANLIEKTILKIKDLK